MRAEWLGAMRQTSCSWAGSIASESMIRPICALALSCLSSSAFAETCVASHYGYSGGRTASGERMNVLSTGCQWQALPKDLPPKSTAHCYFMLWDWDGTLERLHHTLYVATREQEGREASPTAAIIDSQSAKAAQKGAPRSTRKALMRARKSRVASGISLSTRSAFS